MGLRSGQGHILAPVSTLGIVLIAIAAVILLLLAGGYAASRRRDRAGDRDYARRVGEADRALATARAADRGWDRERLEAAARRALEAERPGFEAERLDLVLVDDRPGVEEDRAHLVAGGREGEFSLVLRRRGDDWLLERLE